MTKYFKWFLICISLVTLSACSEKSADKVSTKEENVVRLIVKEDTNKIDEKVSFKKGDTVMDVLKANYKVKEKDGFITAIDGYAQKPKEKTYWFYKVNGKMATKAANALKVKKGDKIYFYMEKIK